jgi:hypothetical protein
MATLRCVWRRQAFCDEMSSLNKADVRVGISSGYPNATFESWISLGNGVFCLCKKKSACRVMDVA